MATPPACDTSPRLCAEALAGIADPIFPALSAARPDSPASCARTALGALVAPLESAAAPDAPPAWLLPHQVDAVTRARAILRRFNGVLVADGVGLGKTWIGLALAQLERDHGGDAVVVAPSPLVDEWRRAAAAASVPVAIHTHAALARRAPAVPARCTAVVVDEAHAFRNPRTLRYDALARLAAGRRVVLLTATPMNNSPADLAALVHLFAGRDRFREFGIADLQAALHQGDPSATFALGAVSVCRTRRLVESRFPDLRSAFPRRVLRPPVPYDLSSVYGGRLDDILAALGAWSRAQEGQAGAALVHLSLLRRLESGRATFRRSLARHRAVLDEITRAAEQGILLSRAQARAAMGRCGDDSQLTMWPLLVSERGEPAWERVGAARQTMDRLATMVDAAAEHSDAKAAALAGLLDGPLRREKVVVFTEYRDTALHLVRVLRRTRRVLAVAGGSGWTAGGTVSRREAFDAFAPAARGATPQPLLDADILVATDIASEGLNLQDARVVVNYDLPWNPVRVMQRVGRIDRLHSPHREIEIAHLVPAAGFRHYVRVLEVLRRKLESVAGTIGAEPDPLAALWWLDADAPHSDALERESWRRVAPFEARERWRALVGPAGRGSVAPVVAAATCNSGPPMVGVLLAVEWPGGRRIPLPFVLRAGQPPRRDAEALGALAERLLTAEPCATDPAAFTNVLATILPAARSWLLELSAARRGGVESGAGRRAVLERLARAGADAHRRRADARAIAGALRLLRHDLPAGLDRILARLAPEAGDAAEFAGRVAELVSRLAPAPGPCLDGTPRLVLVAAFLIANSCPSG